MYGVSKRVERSQKANWPATSFVENLKFQDLEIPMEYTGRIAGDGIQFTRNVVDFATEQLVAKRIVRSPRSDVASGLLKILICPRADFET